MCCSPTGLLCKRKVRRADGYGNTVARQNLCVPGRDGAGDCDSYWDTNSDANVALLADISLSGNPG